MPIRLPSTPLRKPLPPLPLYTPRSPSSSTENDGDVVFLGNICAFMFLALSCLESFIVAFSPSSSQVARHLCGLHLTFAVPVAFWMLITFICPPRYIYVKAFLQSWTVVGAGMTLAVGGVLIMRVGEGILNQLDARRAVVIGGFSIVSSMIMFAVVSEKLYRIDTETRGGLYSPLPTRDEEEGELLIDFEKMPDVPETPDFTPELGPYFAFGVQVIQNAPILRTI